MPQTQKNNERSERISKPTLHLKAPHGGTGAIPANSSGAAILDASRRPDDSNEILYPRCDAAVRNMEAGAWKLADAIVEECSEPGESGV